MAEKSKINVSIPIYKRKLKKTDVHLKKEDKKNWGRFLDNHYNDKLHSKPFGISTKPSQAHYKYSKSGLSHHYKTVKILEKLTVEEQNKREAERRKFKEADQLKGDDIYVFIEYCSNSERTQVSTRHIQEKYEIFAKKFRQGILEKFPFIKVYLKSHSDEEKVTKYTLSDNMNANIIENQRSVVRIGAFEISLARKFRHIVKTELLFSKLKSKLWPSMPILLQKISTHLPKTNLVVNVFNPDNPEDKEGLEEIKVNLRLSFKNCKANDELKEEISKIHDGKINEALQTREKLIKQRSISAQRRYGKITNFSMREESHKMSTASNQRPFTAVSKFSASLHKSIQSMVKQNNEYKRTHGQSVQIPMTRSNGPRNLTAVGRRSVRPSTGASMNTLNIKTMERKNARNAYSSYSIGFKSKKKKKKNGVKVENIEFSSQPNEEYQILFENIPKAVYDIETEESPFFQKASRSVNLMLEGDNKGESMVYLPVERQLTSCTSLYFIKTQDNSDDFNPEIEEPQYFNDLRVRALLLEKASNPYNQEPGEDSDDGNETEYEEEFYYDRSSSCYRCGLEPGKYMLVVDGDDLAQYSETIDIYEGNITQEIILKKKDKKVFLFCVRNGQTGENINSSIVKFKKKTSKSISEVITDERGICTCYLDGFGAYSVQAERKGYITSKLDFQYTKMNQEMDQLTLLMLPVEPLAKKPEENGGEVKPTVRLRMIFYVENAHESGPPMIKYKKEAEGEESTEETCTPNGEIFEDNFYFRIMRAGDSNWYYGEIETNKDKWIRFYQPIANLKVPTYEEIDQFSVCNVKIPQARFILYSEKNELGKVSPSFVDDYHPIWDIGLLNPVQKKFVQTNFFVRNDEKLIRKAMMRPYFKFIQYLNNQNEFYNFSYIFGFNEGVFKFDDYHITALNFYSRMKALDVEWINPEIPEGEQHEEARLDFEAFLHYMSSSMVNVLGEVPLKKVTERFGPHLNIAAKK